MDSSVQAPQTAPQTASGPAAPVLTLTASAIAQIQQVMREQGLSGHFLAVRVVPGGCSGLSQHLDLVKEAKAGDQVWQQDGLTLCTDALSASYLQGTVMDYVKNEVMAGFKFDIPKATSTCGCGSSFSA